MSEPTLNDVLESIKKLSTDTQKSIDKLSTETQTRHESLANESRQRDLAQTERSVRLEAKVDQSVSTLTAGLNTLHSDVATLKSIVPKVESTANEAAKQARESMDSHHELQGESQAHWRSVMDRLEAQDEQAKRLAAEAKADADRREAAKAEARQQESLAAKRMADERDKKIAAAADQARIRNERLKIIAPVWQAVAVAAIAGVVSYLTIQAGHADTNAKMDLQNRQLTSLSQKLESVASVPRGVSVGMADVVVTSPEPSATTTPAPAPAASPRQSTKNASAR